MLRAIGLLMLTGLMGGIAGCPGALDLSDCCDGPAGLATFAVDFSSLTSSRSFDVALPSRVTLTGAGVDCVIWVLPADTAGASVIVEPNGRARITGNYSAIYISGNWPVVETTHTTAAASGLVGLVLPEAAEGGEYVYNAALLAAGGTLGVGPAADQPIALGQFRFMTNQAVGEATALSSVEPGGGAVSTQIAAVLAQIESLEARVE
ncbi:MAG: hypothetical protein JNG88_07235 [Phycisphaerales bacterium]|nr:hypothetical protein [Phycisphaerales bacterium]